MTQEEFNKYYDEIMHELIRKNVDKGAEYSRNNDRFHNFVYGSIIQQMPIMKYLDALRSKHEVSIKDMINDLDHGIEHSKELWLEKITDDIMYLIILYAMANDIQERKKKW